MLKRMLKNEKGLTLIELLVVVVILGIIAAIAIPSIGGLIGNARKDAHVGNAQQMISGARLYATAESNPVSPVDLDTLIEEGYIEPFDHPTGGTYSGSVKITKDTTTNNFVFTVTLSDGDGTLFDDKPQSELTRENVGKP